MLALLIAAVAHLLNLAVLQLSVPDLIRMYTQLGWKQTYQLPRDAWKVSAVDVPKYYKVDFFQNVDMVTGWNLVDGPVVARAGQKASWSVKLDFSGDKATITHDDGYKKRFDASGTPPKGNLPSGRFALGYSHEAKKLTHIYIISRCYVIKTHAVSLTLYADDPYVLYLTKD